MKNDKMKSQEGALNKSAPDNYQAEPVSLSDLAAALSKFAEEYFSGAVTVGWDFEVTELLRISPDGLANFIKALLAKIHGKSKLEINISLSFPFAVIKLSGFDIEPDERLLRIAEISGFKVEASDKHSIILSTEVLKNATLFVYAVSAEELIRRFINAFCT
jgi:hypothetical protein